MKCRYCGEKVGIMEWINYSNVINTVCRFCYFERKEKEEYTEETMAEFKRRTEKSRKAIYTAKRG